MKNLHLPQICVALLALLSCVNDPDRAGSKMIGDFAPLRVGNVWRYAGKDTSNSAHMGISWAVSRSIRRVEVKSQTRSGDTSAWELSVIDSVEGTSWSPGSTYTTDRIVTFGASVLELPDSTLSVNTNDSMIARMFRSHSYSADLLSKAAYDAPDTHQTNVLRTNTIVDTMSGHGWYHRCTQLTIMQDVGLAFSYDSTYNSSYGVERRLKTYSKLEFNGQKISSAN